MRRGALTLLVLASACATVRPPADGRPLLDALQFEGNHQLASAELLLHIATAPSSGLLRKSLRSWDADLFDIDARRIERWYRSRGFFQARVVKVEVAPQAEGHVAVVVHLEEGPRTRLTQVQLEGLQALTDDERGPLAGKLPLRQGDWFDEELYEKTKLVLQQQLREHGFAAASVAGEAQVDEAAATCVLVLTSKTGPRYRFGKVLVKGEEAIPKELIARTTGIERDQPFSQTRLDLAQQRVYNLGVFSGVRVALEPLGDDPVAAVGVNVREAPFQTVRLGAGLQLEPNRFELPQLLAEYTDRSFLGGVRRLELSGHAGYAFTPSITSAENQGIVTRSAAQLTLPEQLGIFDVVGRGEFGREIQDGFSYDTMAARGALVLRRSKLTLSGSLNLVWTFNARFDLAQIGRVAGQAGALLNCSPSCTLIYPELRATWDQRDDVLEPRSGLYAAMGVQWAIPHDNFHYLRFDPELRVYLPLFSTVTLAARAQWGFFLQLGAGDTDPLATTPFDQRFYGGGQNGMRGYAPQAQSPLVQGVSLDSPVPVGGTEMVLASVEVRVHGDFLPKNAALAAFVDAGRVTPITTDPAPASPPADYRAHHSSPFELPFTRMPELAPGVGLRYLTPFGPLRIDVAWVVNPDNSQSTVVLNTEPTLQIRSDCGGAPSGSCLSRKRWAYHLTLGEAF